MTSRRTVVRRSMMVGVASGIAGFAGCSSLSNNTSESNEPDQNESDGRDREATAFTNWLFDPTEIGADSVNFGYTDVSGLLEHDDFTKTQQVRDQYQNRFGDYLDVESIEYALSANNFHIIAGSFEDEVLTNDGELEPDGSYGDFDVYTERSGGSVFAESDERILAAYGSYGPDSDTRTELELSIDTYEGDQSRFIDESDEFSRLLEAVDPGVVVNGAVPTEAAIDDETDGRVGFVSTQRLSDGTLHIVGVELYPTEAAVDTDSISAEYESGTDDTVDVEDVSQDGRFATIRLEATPDDLYPSLGI